MARIRFVASEWLVPFASGVVFGVGSFKLKHRFAAKRRDKQAKKAADAAREQALQRAEAAEALLKAGGYTIVARDAPASYAMIVDGDPQVVHISTDFLVESEGKRLAAEIKVGAAAKLETAATRWQMLEHQHAFGARSVLLVNPDTKAVSTLRFPLPKTALTAVPPPPKQARAASALAQKTAKSKARAAIRRRLIRYLAIAAAMGAVWWMLRDPTQNAASPPQPDERARARPRSSRVITK